MMYKRIFEAGSYLQVYFTMYKTIRTVRVLQGGTIVKEQIKSLVMAISASFLGVSIILFLNNPLRLPSEVFNYGSR